jgi:hypothetical protein
MRWVGIAALGLALSACGGDDDGGGGGGGGGGPPPPTGTVSGTATFDFVPATAQGLDYNGTQARPIRGATVEILSGATVLATTRTDANGAYSVNVAPNMSAFVRVKAELVQSGSPSFDFRVVDNVNGNVLYALDGPTFNTGTATAGSTQNVHAASGWGGLSYTGPRAAAPFAILDTVYTAAQTVLAADATATFPPLRLHWSTNNRPVAGAGGGPNPATGEIVTSFYSPGLGGIFLLGAANVDTEEYDRHVIVHEWGHYFEHGFSRSDNVGGPHTRGDQLDLRVAFSEGWSNALSGLVLADAFYRDTLGPGQAQAGSMNLEGATPANSGWYSEQSVQEILYDLVDATPDGTDALSMGFSALYDAMRNGHATAVSPTSIFTFVNALKGANSGSGPLIDALVTSQSITAVADEYGSTETHNGNGVFPQDVLPVYTPIDVNAAMPVNVCSTNEFEGTATGATNKLGSRRYLRFDASSTASYTFSAVATSIPANQISDPDLVLHRAGQIGISEGPPLQNCTVAAANCTETFSQTLTPGEYVLEVYEWTNTEDDPQFPPIGRTCFEVRVQQ